VRISWDLLVSMSIGIDRRMILKTGLGIDEYSFAI